MSFTFRKNAFLFVDLLKLSGLLSTSSRHKRRMSQTSFEMINMHFITKFEFTEASNGYDLCTLQKWRNDSSPLGQNGIPEHQAFG